MRLRPSPALTVAAALLLGAAASSALAPVPAGWAQDAAAIDGLVQKMKDTAKADDRDGFEKAVGEYEKLKFPDADPEGKGAAALADIARSPTTKNDSIFKTAIKAAAAKKHEGLLGWLKSKLDDKKMIEDRAERYLAILDACAFYGNDLKKIQKDLEDVVKKALGNDKKIEICKRAVIAYGGVETNPTVDELIKWLSETEKSKGGGQGGSGGGGGGGGKAMSEETKKAYAEVNGTISKTLEKLTAQEFADSQQWAKWWKDSEKTFKFPDRNQAVVEPDWPTLKEFPDKAFGFVLKKPTVGNQQGQEVFWKFEKFEIKGGNGRAKLVYRDDKNYVWAQCDIFAWKTWNGATTPEQYNGVLKDKNWPPNPGPPPTGEFEKFSEGGDPAIKAIKLGGRDFSVISARGQGRQGSNWASWDSVERRTYVTMATPTSFLVFECAVRNSAEKPLKDAFWAAMDSMTFTPKK